jgi:hypothetical protein
VKGRGIDKLQKEIDETGKRQEGKNKEARRKSFLTQGHS